MSPLRLRDRVSLCTFTLADGHRMADRFGAAIRDNWWWFWV
jgi:hypothetical protein